MKFDDIIAELGEFGPYQRRIYFLICLVGIPAAIQTMLGVFTLGIPDHRCAIPGLANDTYKIQGPWHDALVNSSVPWSEDDEAYEECQLYQTDPQTGLPTNKTRGCDLWVYSKDPFKSTFVSEIDMICGDKELRTYANMILMGGLLFGSFVLGLLSDLIGRKKVLLIGIVGQFSVSLSTAFVDSYVPFVILRFFTTFFGIGMFLTAFVIGMEFVGPAKRRISGLVIELFWCIGLFVLVFIAYFIRHWNHLQIVCPFFTIVLLIYIFLLPESPRWLISRGKFEEAARIIKRAADGNNVVLPEKMLKLEGIEQEAADEKIWHMFTTPVLLIRCLIVFFNWLVASLVYYGLSLNVGSLSGDIYINFILSSVVELASYIACLFLLDIVGRKLLQCTSMLMGGIACVCMIFPVIYGDDSVEWVTLTLSLIGKFGASAAFAIIYVYSAELFPTVMRNSGMGLSSVAARIGGIMAPYVADIGDVVGGDGGVALPSLIFGGVSILAGLLALKLPETKNKLLPDTVADAKNFGRKKATKNSYAMDNFSNLDDEKGQSNPTFVVD